MALDLNDKPWYVPALVGAVLGIVILFLANMYVYKDHKKQQQGLTNKIDELEREIEKGLAAKANLPKLEEDIRNYQLELDRLRRILPTRKETDNLLKKLKQLMERGHFQLVSFRPQPFQEKEFYHEWPIAVTLNGTYHELGLFFDRLSRFSRIINVNDLSIVPMTSKQETGAGLTIKATFTQRTFIYKE